MTNHPLVHELGLVALSGILDDLDGRRVKINHTIEHVDRREIITRAPAAASLTRAAELRARQALAAM